MVRISNSGKISFSFGMTCCSCIIDPFARSIYKHICKLPLYLTTGKTELSQAVGTLKAQLYRDQVNGVAFITFFSVYDMVLVL